MTTREPTRNERMAVEVGRALRCGRATLTVPGRSAHDALQATATVLADHERRLRSRFGPAWAEEAKLRGLL